MNTTSLEEKKLSIEQQFQAINEHNQQLNQQIVQNNEQLLKLSGQFDLITELLASAPAEKATKEKK